MHFPKHFQPILFSLLGTVSVLHPASADEFRIQVEAESKEARIELCTTKEDCHSILFSGFTIEKNDSHDDDEDVMIENQNENLIDRINDRLFGLLGF